MLGVRVKIIEFVDDSQPGWVRCVLTDAFGRKWFFMEKVPIVTADYLDEKSSYPQYGVINCVIISENGKDNHINIDTSKPYGVYSEEDNTNFTILKTQLIDE
ncbi:hypothetical protein [Niabella hibiscisoli]|uniref:hypothetical protein n=1 Tax=Niabella hibiscisoli TaxID=1825928 RepID=UPI001F0D0247|nr:hypothetical protein [Niabella hibiscisoli]MCH5716429.1 hypothetical protein [Niabella hibiscisoli]